MSKHAPAPAPNWPFWGKLLVSLAICWHFFAILTAVTSEGGPDMAPRLALLAHTETPAHPYLRALFLTNAYRFFAPNPGATGLVWFRIAYEDGTSRWFELPRADEFVLRMPYQRRLALALSIQQNTISNPVDGMMLSPIGRAYVSSYVRHICHKMPKTKQNADGSTTEVPIKTVQVFRVDHDILRPWQIEAGWHHEDLRNYYYFYLGTYLPNGELTENVILSDTIMQFGPSMFGAQALVSEVYPVLEKNGDLTEAALPPPIRKLLKDFPELRDPEIRREILLAAFADPTQQREDIKVELVALSQDRELQRKIEETPRERFHEFLQQNTRLKDVIYLILEAKLAEIIGRHDRAPQSQPIPVPASPGPLDKGTPNSPAKAPVRG